jgi:outer membrane protein OmpA-like peptidoglycan-associated protein
MGDSHGARTDAGAPTDAGQQPRDARPRPGGVSDQPPGQGHAPEHRDTAANNWNEAASQRDYYRPGVSDRLSQSKPSEADRSPRERPSVRADEQKSYADQDKVYRVGISDQQPQSKPGQADWPPREKSTTGSDGQKSYADQDRTYRLDKTDYESEREGKSVGFGFDKDVPAAGEMERWYKGLTNEQKEALEDANTKVTVTATASRRGSREYNQDLSERRAENVARILKERYGVAAQVELEPLGEDPAEDRGVRDGVDDHTDRVVDITILSGVKKAEQGKETPEGEYAKPDRGKKNSIPTKYRCDYKHDREWAQNPTRVTYHKIRMGVKGRLGMLIEAVRQINDAPRYRREIEATKTVHDKLWKVRPMRGFLFDMEKSSFQTRVKGWLREGGYDVEPMYKEYIIHWLRKGAK